ncbi:type III-B CRISPR module-associated protein Cmr3 [Athalassotoga saccharophila]|uniref:type III-B CRISPR module-associated protein Cmr3 n=1 Tax=Athalassotoga saccharophila TaxID=1441386 RepID=UPI001E3CCC74|nr:type III-B CRISPR module-associated protein Cmr3 [Athalassotoga saccharophila]BBJ28678.1 CRISPR-associated RAMP Cmr3 [Athalassotoga saccharophila]
MIEITPLDTLFFRNTKEYTMGEETTANSIFPPMPSTIYGAIRTAYFSEHSESFKFVNTDKDPTKSLKIKGVFLKDKDGSIFLQTPLDFVLPKDQNDSNELFKLVLDKKPDRFYSNFKLPKLLTSPVNKKVESLENSYFNITSIVTQSPLFKAENLIKYETHIGIGRNKLKTTDEEEGRLYKARMVRPNLLKSFLVDYDGLELTNGILKLGGEGKAAYYKEIEIPRSIQQLFRVSELKDYLRLYLMTPAYFKKGWIPSWLDENFEGKYKNLHLKLITAVVGKPIMAGGYDIAKNKPKMMKKFVPAGSVYYFEVLKGDFESIKSAFQYQSISEELSSEGFGITILFY